jgi:hypothetical protein
MLGRAHSNLTDDPQNPLPIIVPDDGVGDPLPILVAKTKRIEQSGRTAGVAGNAELVRGYCC